MNSRERVLAHLAGQPVDRLPVMPIAMQLAADLAGARYLDYATDYRILAEGQLRAAGRYGFDYVNTMSDPAREAADCGAAVEFFENSPSAMIEDHALLADKSALASLRMPDPSSGRRMSNGIQAVALLRQRVGGDKIVEGWIEGPCAEAADLRGINTLMLDFYDDPAFVRELFDWVIELGLRFAAEQVRAGADLIGVGDAAASLIGPALYREFVWPAEKKLIDGLHALGTKVRLHICGNTRFAFEPMGRLGADIIDLDFLAPLAEARAAMPAGQVLLGNLNPVAVLRNGSESSVLAHLARCHAEAGPRFIAGAGCEIPRDSPPENILAFSAYARGRAPADYAAP